MHEELEALLKSLIRLILVSYCSRAVEMWHIPPPFQQHVPSPEMLGLFRK